MIFEQSLDKKKRFLLLWSNKTLDYLQIDQGTFSLQQMGNACPKEGFSQNHFDQVLNQT